LEKREKSAQNRGSAPICSYSHLFKRWENNFVPLERNYQGSTKSFGKSGL
jgi:hypothetical protein